MLALYKVRSEKVIDLAVLLVRILFSVDSSLSFSLTTRLFINSLLTLTGYRPLVNHLLRIFLTVITSSRTVP